MNAIRFCNLQFIANRLCPSQQLLILVLYLVCHVASASGPEKFKLVEIGNDIFVHQGVHVGFDDPRQDDIANIGFIIGDACIAVIDTGGSVRVGQSLLAAIKEKSDLPVCYVINTHVHYDHVLGNSAFTNEAPVFIGHHELVLSMEQNRAFFMEQFSTYLGPEPSPDSIVGPDIGVRDTLVIDLGERLLTLTAHRTGHSYTDLSVYDHDSNTLWLSDILFIDRIPALDGSLRGWLEVMRQQARVKAVAAVPGHGPVSVAWPRSMEKQADYLTLLLDQTRKFIAAGSFMEEIVEKVGVDEKQNWLLFDQHHKRNVTRAFTELEWE